MMFLQARRREAQELRESENSWRSARRGDVSSSSSSLLSLALQLTPLPLPFGSFG